MSQNGSSTHTTPNEHEDLGVEDSSKARRAYLVTAPHPDKPFSSDGHMLVPPGSFTREQICTCMLAALAATQASRLEPMAFLFMVVFLERHISNHVHFHIAVVADRCFRFAPLKRELLKQRGLATHWSCTHDGYASCVAYGYAPSPKKPPPSSAAGAGRATRRRRSSIYTIR